NSLSVEPVLRVCQVALLLHLRIRDIFQEMLFKSLAVSVLAGAAIAQDLTTLLANTTELSNLTTYLGLFPDLVGQLASLQNITLLAPNNAAFSRLLNSSAGAALVNNDTSLIQALFTYHVLNGTYANF